jgi:hypothetical protein
MAFRNKEGKLESAMDNAPTIGRVENGQFYPSVMGKDPKIPTGYVEGNLVYPAVMGRGSKIPIGRVDENGVVRRYVVGGPLSGQVNARRYGGPNQKKR